MKIVKLEAENVKRLKAITIEPKGNMVVIGGKNGHGKSSTLDSIMYALGGKRALPEQPVRAGEEKATIRLALDTDFVITREIAQNGSGTLAVTTRTDAKFSRPQELLDSFCARFTFDPLQFKSLEPRQQVALLREIAGIDFSSLDAKKKDLTPRKTTASAQVKALEAELKKLPYHEINPGALDDSAIVQTIAQAQEKRSKWQSAQYNADTEEQTIKALHHQIVSLEQQIEQRRQDIHAREQARAAYLSFLRDPANQPTDTQEVEAQLKACREAQKKAAENDHYLDKQRAANRLRKTVNDLDTELQRVDKERASLLAAAKLPVAGLGFSDDDGSITYNDIPFSQLSQAEQLRLSVAMGAALNPELRVLLVRDGSLLDDDNLSLLAQLAQEQDLQVWLERVGEGKECSFIIEDGEVRA